MRLLVGLTCQLSALVTVTTFGMTNVAFAQRSVGFSSLFVKPTIHVLSRSPNGVLPGIAAIPGKKVLLGGYVEYNTSTCEEISSGTWTVTTPPQFGTTSDGKIKAALGNGDCPGKTFTFGVLYYTLDKDSTATSDSLSATWTSPDFSFPNDFSLTLPSITFVSQDITQDSIVVDPEPSGISGTLTITAVGNNAKPVVVNQSVSGGAQVSLQYGETTTPLPASKYTKLEATWVVDNVRFKGSTPIKFTVLGLYQNTVYNTPAESMCTGAASAVTLWKAAKKCVSSTGSYKTDFQSQTRLNGSGAPLIGGLTAPEHFCAGGILDFRHPYTLKPSCSGQVVSNTTIAVDLHGGTLECKDNVFFVGEQPSGSTIGISKTVTDNCPACSSSSSGTTGHVDNYTTDNACSAISLPNYQAILLGK